MKKTLLLLSLSLCLISCGKVTPPSTLPIGMPSPTNAPFPTSQSDSPAAKYCLSRSGSLSLEKSGSGMEIAYCTLSDGQKTDAWKLFDLSTQPVATGSVATGTII